MHKDPICRIGIIGWRGLVGQVLLERLNIHGHLKDLNITLFSSKKSVELKQTLDAKTIDFALSDDLTNLLNCDLLLSCQGSDYTKVMLPTLLKQQWTGYWLDAASHLRTNPKATLVLDPINNSAIESALKQKQTIFVGPNCCTSLLLLALQGLYSKQIIQYVDTHSYQAISGAGTKPLTEYLSQIQAAVEHIAPDNLIETCHRLESPSNGFSWLNNVTPWIDVMCDDGWTNEELKFEREATILRQNKTPISATCVRVNTLRCHSQSITVTLNDHYALDDIKSWLSSGNPWVKLVDNHADNRGLLTPKHISNTLQITIGRIRQDSYRPNVIHLFTVGDQLLWGAAEPLVRVCGMILEHTKHQALGTNMDQVDCFK